MAAVPQALTHLFIITTVFITLLLLELLISLRTLFKFLSFTTSPTSFLQLIEHKVPTTLFKLRPLPHESSSDCSVCLSKFEDGDQIRKLKCKHTFHKDCLDRWLEQEFATCPLCRREVLPRELAGRFRRRPEEVSQDQYDGSDEELIFLLSALQVLIEIEGYLHEQKKYRRNQETNIYEMKRMLQAEKNPVEAARLI